MEQTPFDPFHDSKAETPLPPPSPPSFDDFSQSVPPPTPSTSPSFSTPTMHIEAQLPPVRPKRKKPALWAVPLALLLLVGGGVGFTLWNKQQEAIAREQKLAALRADIKKIVLQDNALVMELLDDDALEHITYAEFFERADNNKESRDALVRQLRATESGPYGEDVGRYIELLEEENKWVRAEEAVSRAQLDCSSKNDIVTRASGQADTADGQVQESRQAYLSAPYGEDFSEKMGYDIAISRAKNANDSARQALEEWKTAEQELREKKRVAFVVISNWLRDEPVKYPRFAPTRTVATLLTTRKASYAGAISTAQSPGNAKAQIVPVEDSDDTTTPTAAQPTATPEPTGPTRTHSLTPLDGERFSETRMEDIGQEFASNLGDDDLRYAINEMYARYGMTFKNKSLQSQFEQTDWYHPDDKWTMPQVKAAFSKRERDNLNTLIKERNQRRQGNSDTGERTTESWE